MTRQLEQAAFLHSSKLLMLTEVVAGLPLPSLMCYIYLAQKALWREVSLIGRSLRERQKISSGAAPVPVQ